MKLKSAIIIGIFLFTACGNVCGNKSYNQIEEKQTEIKAYCNESIEDILLLKSNAELFNSLFDEIEKWKVENNAEDLSNNNAFGEITKPVLQDFLENLDIEEFKTQGIFSQKYEFVIMPKEFESEENCADSIILYYEECGFRLCVHTNFYVEDVGCDESLTTYYFKIKENN
jgi:hypothetical protein